MTTRRFALQAVPFHTCTTLTHTQQNIV